MRIAVLSVFALLLAAGCNPNSPTLAEPGAATAPTAPTTIDVVNVPPAEVAAKLAGKWQSADDAKSTLTITAEGRWTEDYVIEPPVHEVSTWRAFAGSNAPADTTGNVFTPTSTYLEVKGANATFFYELGSVEADSFDIFYVARGNRLAFTRQKEVP
jgi:hypothetical protein